MHHGAYRHGAIGWVLVEVNDIVFMRHQLISTLNSAAGATWKAGVAQFINLLVYQQPHVNRSNFIVATNPGMYGIKV